MANMGSVRPDNISLTPANPNEVPRVVPVAMPSGVPRGRTVATAAQLANTPGTRYVIGDTGHPQIPNLADGDTSLERRVSNA